MRTDSELVLQEDLQMPGWRAALQTETGLCCVERDETITSIEKEEVCGENEVARLLCGETVQSKAVSKQGSAEMELQK
jgi:hypothetical protein